MVGEGKKQITGFSTRDDMAKSLGQIHTVNYELGAPGVPAASSFLIDLPGQLTSQLQTMCRMGCYYKVVGIDMALRNIAGTSVLDPQNVSGRILYYAPTRGRCEAYKQAFRAVKKGMELQGINTRGNRHYDFRVPITLPSCVANGAEFLNAATIDGTNNLTLDASAGSVTDEVFTVYNSNIQPEQTATVDFSAGYGLPGSGSGTDYVLNEGEYYEGTMTRFASLDFESIPFQLSYGQDSTTNTATAFEMEWRPDPALFLAVMTGQFVVEIDSSSSSTADLIIDMAIHVSGWKSIMVNPDKKRRSSKRSSKTRGRKK
jgi:hypothetical protein